MKRIKYPVCSECGEEINPQKYDGCEKYYLTAEGKVVCRDCFIEGQIEYLELNTDDYADLIGVRVVAL